MHTPANFIFLQRDYFQQLDMACIVSKIFAIKEIIWDQVLKIAPYIMQDINARVMVFTRKGTFFGLHL